MIVGDVIPTKSIRVVLQDGSGWADFKAPKGEQFVFLLLGTEAVKGEPRLDPVSAIKALGWVPAKGSLRARALHGGK